MRLAAEVIAIIGGLIVMAIWAAALAFTLRITIEGAATGDWNAIAAGGLASFTLIAIATID